MKRWHQYLLIFLVTFGNIKSIHAQSRPDVLGSPDAIVYDLELIQDEEIVVFSSTDNVQLWNLKTKTLLNTLNSSHVLALDYMNATNKLAGVSKSGSIVIWNIADGKEALQQKITESTLTCVAWIDDVFLAVGTDDGELVKVNSISGEIISRIKTHATITAMCAGRGNTLIVGDANGMLATYDSREMQLKSSVKGHKSWIREIRMSSNDGNYVTVSDDGYCKMWKSDTDSRVVRRTSIGNWLLCADYSESPDKGFDLTALGKRSGDVTIVTRFVDYTYGFNSIVNCIRIVKSALPKILVVAGTHGGGLQLLSAEAMKMK